MGACSEDPHLCGASWLLRFTSLLLSVCSAVTQSPRARGSAVDNSRVPVPLKGIQGDSVLFRTIRNQEISLGGELEKMSWGIKTGSIYTTILRVSPGGNVPQWVNFQDKFEKRVHVLNTTTLRFDNLTLEDSGLYQAQESYTTGIDYDQYFHLTVYEPVPLPQIRATDLSLTPGWCNLTLECDLTRTREDLMVSWESKGFPRELEERPAPGPAANPWTLAVNMPLSQPSPSLSCVVSNQADQKTATLDLADICGHASDQVPSESPCAWQWASSVLCCLNLRHSLCDGNRCARTDQCCPLARYPGVCCGPAADPRSWAVPLQEMWENEERGAQERGRITGGAQRPGWWHPLCRAEPPEVQRPQGQG